MQNFQILWMAKISWGANFCPPPFGKSGDIKTHSSVCLSVSPSVSLSVTKTLTWLISSEVLMIEHWYLAYMILVTSPFYSYHAVTLTFDLLQGQICCRAGDHNSSNLLVMVFVEGPIHEFQDPRSGGPPPCNKFDLEVGQKSRSRHGMNRKGLSQGSCMPNINALSLILQKIWARLKFLWQTD